MKKERKKLPREMLTIEEVKKLAKHTNNLRDRCFILILYESGARIGELLNLKIKDIEFDKAPFGTIGLETALAVSLTQLYHTKMMKLDGIVRLLSINPQEIMGLRDFAEVKKGIEANLCLVDINKEWTVEKKDFSSRSKNSAFMGRKLKGKVIATVCKGSLYRFA